MQLEYRTYRHIFIIDSIQYYNKDIENKYTIEEDLILTFDLNLYKYIQNLGGKVEYLDHIVNDDILENYNYIIYDFFGSWHYDSDGKDIFHYKGVDFGFSFRLEFWNDYTTYIRLFLSINQLKSLQFEKIILISKNSMIVDILHTLDVSYTSLTTEQNLKQNSYFFPITEWLDSKIKPSGFRKFLYKIRAMITYFYGKLMPYIDKLLLRKTKYTVFIQEYHPTRKIIQNLRCKKDVKVLLSNFSRFSKSKINNLRERLIPISENTNIFIDLEKKYLNTLKNRKYHKLVLEGIDISDEIYDLIEDKIQTRVSNNLNTLDSCIDYIEKNQIDLVVLIANIGHIDTLFDLVCKSKNIPSYMVINGMLLNNHQDEAKYATVINSYGESIKENYFKDMDNIVTLGDPRMDIYANIEKNNINREVPTITIGASGFNPVVLNSYVAVEFDFMYDILSAFKTLRQKGEKFNIIIKVRPNGYKQQYLDFSKDYFKDLSITIESTAPMIEVLKKTDFYISIYSQTLFEASCLGIPVVYYKKDTEINNKPFNGKSELVTIDNKNDLIQAFYDFQNKHERYKLFLDRKIMEKYIGFLDGKNLERNLEFIENILNNGIDNVEMA
jgi:hypothetical protein